MGYDAEENYCSFSPESLFGVKFNFACYLHDRQYRNEVKWRKSRLGADLDLKKGIMENYLKKRKWVAGFFVSWIYFLAVRIFSGRYWVKQHG